eukprot:TRINITY_DN61352_c0_g1_i1.p1 TRINITY_DN61352_c0_g1~~TRINITY_DN61352_c0_g1_i1.p1  ORF type:complete len:422 (+),score=36.24 TRINITY_DN61352_c0_g1_i1:30-1295(+)
MSHPLATDRIEVNFGPPYGIEYFDVYKRYKITQPIGSGGYGYVVEAEDIYSTNSTGDGPLLVAIKKLPGIFRHPDLTKSALREIATLQHFKHSNILRIRDIIIPLPETPEGDINMEKGSFSDVYVVVDRMDMDLAELLKHSGTEIQAIQRRFFCYQILRGLKCIHSANALHRDLKPANLLINEECDLKIADFGLARTADITMTTNVQTQWYRAPELLLEALTGNQEARYSGAVDIWSCGCILSELMLGGPIFQGKPNNLSQLNAIYEIIGTPQLDDNSLPSNMREFVEKQAEKHEPKPWDEIFPPDRFDSDEVELVSKMLRNLPQDRITVTEALACKYFEPFHDPRDEPEADGDFVFRYAHVSSPKLAMLQEFCRFHPEIQSKVEALVSNTDESGGGQAPARREDSLFSSDSTFTMGSEHP